MSLGQNIHDLRVKNGMTQKQLADQLFVTAQAVSRWENNEVEPSITVLNTMAEIFNVNIDVIVNGVEIEEPLPELVEEKEEQSEPAPVKVPLTTCHDCSEPIYEGDRLLKVTRSHVNKYGRTNRYVNEVVTLCEKCYQIQIDKDEQKAKEEKELELKKIRKKRIRAYSFGIIAGVVALILALIYGVSEYSSSKLWLVILISILCAYGFFSFVYCLIIESYISDVFEKVLEIGFVKFPGIIFSFSIDGVIFLILMKVLFWILGALIAIFGLLLALAICVPLSMVTFPFYIKKMPAVD